MILAPIRYCDKTPTHTTCAQCIAAMVLLCVTVGLQSCAFKSAGYIENEVLSDGLTGSNEDRNLTQSNAVAWLDRKESSFLRTSLSAANSTSEFWIREFRDCKSKIDSNRVGKTLDPIDIELGLTAFTPDKIAATTVQDSDRPYASLTYLNASQIIDCSTQRQSDLIVNKIYRTGFTLGMLGLSIGEDAQRYLHVTAGVSSSTPNGWENQISESGEPTFMYSLERQRLIYDQSLLPKFLKHIQLSTSIGFNAGYYTNAFVGGDVRLLLKNGVPETGFESAFFETGRSRISSGNEVDQAGDRYFFAGVRARAVLYNSLLQGQFRESQYELSQEEVSDQVTLASVGISDTLTGWCQFFTLEDVWSLFNKSWRPARLFCKNFPAAETRMTYAIHARTPEYDGGDDTRIHSWGGLYFSNRFR